MEISVRAAGDGDAAAIAAIYNQGIEEREATFESEPRAAEDIARSLGAAGDAPFLVAEDGERVVAFARVTEYDPRACYAGVGEASIYVEREARRAGVGRELLAALMRAAEGCGYWKVVGLQFTSNRPSRELCAAAGFTEVGTFRRHGRLDGAWRDVLLIERLLGEAASG